MIPPETLAALRFGTGLPLPDGAAADAAGMAAALSGPDAAAALYPAPGVAEVWPLQAAAVEATRMSRSSGEKDAVKAARRALAAAGDTGAKATIARAIDAPDPFRERLVRFWADHFTVRARRGTELALVTAFVEDAIRPHVTGRFADMLLAATLHPAMLMSLDQVSSIGPGSRIGLRRNRGLNENLARELIELHTLGVGAAYTQTDVRELAELLTGLGVSGDEGFVFRPDWAEPGPETVLGRRYDGDGLVPVRALLADLAGRAETAAHLSRKLAVHFVSDTPDPALVAALNAVWVDTGGDLAAVSRALLEHPAAWDGPLHKARQPFDFIVAALKALGIGGGEVVATGAGQFRRRLLLPMGGMGQPFGNPRGPDGWPEEAEAWITPQGLAARVAWALTQPEALVRGGLPDPRELALRALGPAADERLLWAAARAESRREGIGLVFAAPAFNRR
jgi:uncharacterized protein (DUF1800 family)